MTRMHHLRCELWLPLPRSSVFPFFANPDNLALITPPQMRFKMRGHRSRQMRPGLLIDHTIYWLGLPLQWQSRIARYDPPHFFVDQQAQGPYRYWSHTHTFNEDNGGTLIGDHVEYQLPLGPLGEVAQAIMVRRQLEGIFSYRQKRVREILLGADAPKAIERPTTFT